MLAAGGAQRNRGIDLNLAGALTPGLRVILGVSLTDAVVRKTAGETNDGRQAPGIPAYGANANIDHDVNRALTLTGRIVTTGRQYVNAANTLRLGGWTRIDLGARYVLPLGPTAATLRAGVDNVANARYWASAFDSFSSAILQGRPRTAQASLTIGF